MEKLLKEQLQLIKPDSAEMKQINAQTKQIVIALKDKIKKKKISADVFVGGSVAKGTIIRKKKYDVDIFVRFASKYDEKTLSTLLKSLIPAGANKIHGSRDYFSLKKAKQGLEFEIIPTIKIAKPIQAKNITDLSYFHVSYIKKQINKNKDLDLADEIRLAKAFAYCQECYGAESYINGFSGYVIELLVANYGSFRGFVKAMAQAKPGLIIDMANAYKNEKQLKQEMNEAKLQSPIILVDPTFPERNALAALSPQTFTKFQKICKAFIKKPTVSYFELTDKHAMLEKKHKDKLVKVHLKTKRQAGDIAGTKLKKFYRYFIREVEDLFDIKVHDFDYDELTNTGTIFLVLEPKKQIILQGPPVKMKQAVAFFKKKHKSAKVKAGRLQYVQKLNNLTFPKFLTDFQKAKKRIIKEMSVDFK